MFQRLHTPKSIPHGNRLRIAAGSWNRTAQDLVESSRAGVTLLRDSANLTGTNECEHQISVEDNRDARLTLEAFK